MKKILLIIACILILTGCKENKETTNLNVKEVETSLKTLKIKDTTPFANTESINDLDLIEGYGIDVTLLEEYIIYISSSVEDPSMYMVVKPKKDKESIVKFQIEDMFDKYLNAYKGYYPEVATMIEDKMEKEYNGYYIYIVSSDNEKVYNKILECKE